MQPWWMPMVLAVISGLFGAPLWNFVSSKLRLEGSELDRLRGELKVDEDEIEQLKRRLAIIETHHASHFARWISDSHKRIIWCNPKALLSIFAPIGFSRDDISGKTFHELVDTNAAGEIDRLAARALAQDGAAVSTLIRLHPDLPVMHLVKVAASGREGELIYEAIAFRMNDPEITFAAGVMRQAAQRAESLDRLASDDEQPEN